MTEQIQKKSLKIEVKKDGFTINTDSSNNDLMMMGLVVVLVISVVGIWAMYKIKTKENKDV